MRRDGGRLRTPERHGRVGEGAGAGKGLGRDVAPAYSRGRVTRPVTLANMGEKVTSRHDDLRGILAVLGGLANQRAASVEGKCERSQSGQSQAAGWVRGLRDTCTLQADPDEGVGLGILQRSTTQYNLGCRASTGKRCNYAVQPFPSHCLTPFNADRWRDPTHHLHRSAGARAGLTEPMAIRGAAMPGWALCCGPRGLRAPRTSSVSSSGVSLSQGTLR